MFYMAFREELSQEKMPTGRPNMLDQFVATQPDADEIREALADPTVSTGAIYRTLKKRGFMGHESTVMRLARYARTGR